MQNMEHDIGHCMEHNGVMEGAIVPFLCFAANNGFLTPPG